MSDEKKLIIECIWKNPMEKKKVQIFLMNKNFKDIKKSIFS